MISANDLIAYTSDSANTCANEELQQRLSMYQVFLKLYEHNRGLLNEILRLENSGSKSLAGVALPYVQGIVLDQQIYLVTNLLGGKTQALVQPQEVWTIGRDHRKVGIAIQDGCLSRCHASIQYINDQGFYLKDLGSSNGSFLNGEQIWRSVALKDGDRVRLGSLAFVFFICQTAQILEPLPSEVLTHPASKPEERQSLREAPHLHFARSAMPPHKQSNFPTVKPLQETFTFRHPETEY
ncbi:MAG: FHA domain-containing protein [Leptolyngbyaceae cyanobacterium CRU_2_3]|nr:FHA domain-containing protein [Leptolyngbyaceae cyanobacterium CRU_2_3]